MNCVFLLLFSISSSFYRVPFLWLLPIFKLFEHVGDDLKVERALSQICIIRMNKAVFIYCKTDYLLGLHFIVFVYMHMKLLIQCYTIVPRLKGRRTGARRREQDRELIRGFSKIVCSEGPSCTRLTGVLLRSSCFLSWL